jgi:tRNA threonylcarbamoyladenosine biosynthesis protein TsaE
MSTKKITSNSPKETHKIAAKFAKQILRLKTKKNAVVLTLRGNLGAGKTTFLQGFAKGLGIKSKINSPTFIIMKRFKIKDLRFRNFYHIDCYRLNKPREILDLGFKEIISDPQNIVAIEWPEIVEKIVFQNIILLKFKNIKDNKRNLIISGV